jgi:hypothetical protein
MDPGYCGITGNELADHAAGAAALQVIGKSPLDGQPLVPRSVSRCLFRASPGNVLGLPTCEIMILLTV